MGSFTKFDTNFALSKYSRGFIQPDVLVSYWSVSVAINYS